MGIGVVLSKTIAAMHSTCTGYNQQCSGRILLQEPCCDQCLTVAHRITGKSSVYGCFLDKRENLSEQWMFRIPRRNFRQIFPRDKELKIFCRALGCTAVCIWKLKNLAQMLRGSDGIPQRLLPTICGMAIGIGGDIQRWGRYNVHPSRISPTQKKQRRDRGKL